MRRTGEAGQRRIAQPIRVLSSRYCSRKCKFMGDGWGCRDGVEYSFCDAFEGAKCIHDEGHILRCKQCLRAEL